MYAKRLYELVYKFDYEKATALSNEIHEAEMQGYEISEREDELWSDLTLLALRHERQNVS